MLFLDDKKVMKPTKNDLIKQLRDSGVLDKSNIRNVKQELDKSIRNNEVTVIILRHKK